MTGSAGEHKSSAAQSRAALGERLRENRAEIEQAALARVQAIADPTEPTDPTYIEGLRAAVGAALDYGLAAIEAGDGNPPQLPPILLIQARLAARNGVSLDTVLRRYFAGYTLLNDFLIEQAEDGLLTGTALRRMLRGQAAIFDRLLAAVSEEYGREASRRPSSSEQRRTERVRRLIEGEPLDTAELAYDFEASHLGMIASGPQATELLRDIATSLDRRLLWVRPEEQTAWAWLGGRRAPDPEKLDLLIASGLEEQTAIAVGEPAEGLGGWRFTHQQARAALPIAQQRPGSPVHYADVALLTTIMRDDLLATSLRQLYLAPLEHERDGGEAARKTLRAYFSAGRNVSSAAAALGVKRHTVTNRLRTIEDDLGRPLDSCASDIEVALRLAEIPPVIPIRTQQ